MKKTNVLFNFLIVTLLFFAFSSCSNEPIQDANEEITVAEQSSRLENDGPIDEGSVVLEVITRGVIIL
ncbi:hypothetical protein N7U66_04180 [Lacinutrix neustonica]|uniref:Uncharacterized protein n=1 Tax=Lacinutrix neustonica TaxID=2980107 RepID=A0A9E8SHM0_9FLAO|nr:hypothetical protein [Lacinutrix neustonica]WAC02840.1 hypothetical protein N7U66_04180 [Lacinutrix neustonica]